MLCILLSLVLAILAYFPLKKPFKYWIDRNVTQSTPLPIVGDNWGILTRKQSMAEFIKCVYNMHSHKRYSGIYQFLTPMLVIRDPDLIKQITVKDYDSFLDHRTIISAEADPFFQKNLFALKGQKWREMRTTVSPVFTSSKMKQMFVLMSDAAEQFVNYFLKKNEDVITVEIKDIFSRFTNDVIASVAFGIKCDSLQDQNNEFYLMGRMATNFRGLWKRIKYYGHFLFPKLYAFFKINFFPKEFINFFCNLVAANIEDRRKYGTVRPDLISLLMEAANANSDAQHDDTQPNEDAGFATAQESSLTKHSTRKSEITDIDIAAQGLVFFFAGFASVASLMSFMAYEIAINPHVQDRLKQEVDQTYEECNGKLTYEALLKMKYLDMVTSETLRKWPNGVSFDRVCTKPYVIEPKTADESPVYLQKGDILLVPIYGIHHDPQYYPEPEKFDPERFNDDNKHSINPYTFLTFGSGPRNCIGSRFTLLETKALFFYILSNFEIVPVAKTVIPLRINRNDLSLTPEGGFWLGLKRRSDGKRGVGDCIGA